MSRKSANKNTLETDSHPSRKCLSRWEGSLKRDQKYGVRRAFASAIPDLTAKIVAMKGCRRKRNFNGPSMRPQTNSVTQPKKPSIFRTPFRLQSQGLPPVLQSLLKPFSAPRRHLSCPGRFHVITRTLRFYASISHLKQSGDIILLLLDCLLF